MVQQTFNILKELRDRGVSILMIEQNARSALEISDYGIVLELGQTRLVDTAQRVLNDPRIGQLFLGGAMTESRMNTPCDRSGGRGADRPKISSWSRRRMIGYWTDRRFLA